MSNETCTVSIADIYGAEWWERNKAELEREWEWSFGVANGEHTVASIYCGNLVPIHQSGIYIILHRRKPKVPTLRDVYGTDEVTIPVGWEWTGEWRVPLKGDHFQSGGCMTLSATVHTCNRDRWVEERLILRERQKKVWFKAEEAPRFPKAGDWFIDDGRWCNAIHEWKHNIRICATRHEEIDQTVQVVKQAMVDEVVGR